MTRSYDHHDDAILVALTLSGEREAFTPLVARYYPGVLGLCVRLLGPVTEAEDVAQEVVLQAYLGLSGLRSHEDVGAWIYAIAANQCRSVLKKPRPLSLSGLDEYQQPACPRSDPGALAADRELHRMILEAIHTLPDINRDVVTGFYLEGYSYKELEDLLDVPVKKVKSRLFEARRTLRKTLAPVAEAYGLKKEQEMKQPEQVEAELKGVTECYMADETLLTMHVIDQEQYLSIRLTSDESRMLENALREDNQGAPASHDLSYRILEQLGAEVKQVLIDHLVGLQCIVRITYVLDAADYKLDVRVGEGLALAILCKAPIYITTRTIDAIGVELQVERKCEGPNRPPQSRAPKPQYLLNDYVWRFMMDVQFCGIDEQTITTLKKELWDDLFPSKELTWEGEDVRAIEVSYENPTDAPGRRSKKIWLLVPPYIWDHFSGIDVIKPLKEKQFPRQPQPVLPDPPIDETLHKEIDSIVSEGFKELHALGVQLISLMSRNGKMLSGYSDIGPREAEIFGINIVRQERMNEFQERLISVPGYNGHPIYYSWDDGTYAGLSIDSYSEPIDGCSSVLISGHWILALGISPRADENPETERIWQDLYLNKLKAVLPDLSDHYQMGYYSK